MRFEEALALMRNGITVQIAHIKCKVKDLELWVSDPCRGTNDFVREYVIGNYFLFSEDWKIADNQLVLQEPAYQQLKQVMLRTGKAGIQPAYNPIREEVQKLRDVLWNSQQIEFEEYT